MSEPYTGGCACGAIRYEVSSEPVFMNHCQCRDCQRISGTGHGSYLTFMGMSNVKLDGKASHWRMTDDNGHFKIHSFCARCGTPVYMSWEKAPEAFTITAGSLDDPSRFRPQAVTFSVRGYGWDKLDPELVKFEKMPPR